MWESGNCMAETGCCVSTKEMMYDKTVSSASHHPAKPYNLHQFPLELKTFKTAIVVGRWAPPKNLHSFFLCSRMRDSKRARKNPIFARPLCSFVTRCFQFCVEKGARALQNRLGRRSQPWLSSSKLLWQTACAREACV